MARDHEGMPLENVLASLQDELRDRDHPALDEETWRLIDVSPRNGQCAVVPKTSWRGVVLLSPVRVLGAQHDFGDETNSPEYLSGAYVGWNCLACV
uniref:Uncharacterized protein n=1 Tax=Lepeophtheirus salmonis TaxID=72036 RepID=A0A0K2TDI8_LEPSM